MRWRKQKISNELGLRLYYNLKPLSGWVGCLLTYPGGETAKWKPPPITIPSAYPPSHQVSDENQNKDKKQNMVIRRAPNNTWLQLKHIYIISKIYQLDLDTRINNSFLTQKSKLIRISWDSQIFSFNRRIPQVLHSYRCY